MIIYDNMIIFSNGWETQFAAPRMDANGAPYRSSPPKCNMKHSHMVLEDDPPNGLGR